MEQFLTLGKEMCVLELMQTKKKRKDRNQNGYIGTFDFLCISVLFSLPPNNSINTTITTSTNTTTDTHTNNVI